MGSGILQLAAFGEQDIYLTGNPQMTFFKTVYRRHTNFAIEPIALDINTTMNFGGGTTHATIKPNGDLVGNIYLEVTIKGKASTHSKFTVDHFGNALIKDVSIKIGGIEIDKHNSQWLQMTRELGNKQYSKKQYYKETSTGPNGGKNIPNYNPGIGWGRKYWTYDMNHIDIMDRNVGDCPLVFGGVKHKTGLVVGNGSKQGMPFGTTYTKKFYIPLQFWFNKYPGLALPLIALRNQEVELDINFETANNLKGNLNLDASDELKLDDIKIYADYYYLDKSERQLFQNRTHEYLIETLQIMKDQTNVIVNDDGITSQSANYFLTFQHPVKYIAWAITNPGTNGSNRAQGPCYFISLCSNSQHGDDGHDGQVSLKFANIDRFEERPMSYFTRLLPMKYCNGNIPDLDRIGMYSFALNPFDLQPSGTLNFSKIQTDKVLRMGIANLYLKSLFNKTVNDRVLEVKKDLYVFAVNYNVLRIENGYGGLLFS